MQRSRQYRYTRVWLVLVVSLTSWMLIFSPAASAATAPVLSQPADKYSKPYNTVTTFTWTGPLQGDPDTLDRSYFKLEIAPQDTVPKGQNAAWNSLEAQKITTPGEAENSLVMAMPAPDIYRWRVCAWGVVDDELSNSIERLACSTSRAMQSEAKTSSALTTKRQTITNTIQTQGTQTTETQETSQPAPQVVRREVVVPREVEPEFATDGVEEIEPGSVLDVNGEGVGFGGADGLLGKGFGAIGLAGGAILDALNAEIPGIPIPLWTLVLFLSPFPLIMLWKKYALEMFDLSEPTETKDPVT